jgi:alcohol dehydrogenase, propanol-preferring
MSTAGTRHPRVIAVDIHDDKRTTARELGAEHTVNAATEDAVSAIKALGGADAAIVTVVSPIAFRSAFDAMARSGTLVFVGLPAHNEVEIPIFQTVLNGITSRARSSARTWTSRRSSGCASRAGPEC